MMSCIVRAAGCRASPLMLRQQCRHNLSRLPVLAINFAPKHSQHMQGRNYSSKEKLPLSFSHMGMFVESPEKLSEFYTRFLGFTITDRGTLPNPKGPEHDPLRLVFMSRDPEEHHQVVLVSGRPNTEPMPFNNINQISFRTDSLATLREIHQRLTSEHDVTEINPVTHGNAISIYFKDPEGNRLECFFDTPWYVSQPCRVPVDLTKTDSEIMAFTEKLARELPGFCPRSEWVARMRVKMGMEAE